MQLNKVQIESYTVLFHLIANFHGNKNRTTVEFNRCKARSKSLDISVQKSLRINEHDSRLYNNKNGFSIVIK